MIRVCNLLNFLQRQQFCFSNIDKNIVEGYNNHIKSLILGVNMANKYIGTFAGEQIEADTKQEYIISALTKLYEKNKQLDPVGRMAAYVDYFVDNFSYDKSLRERVISTNGSDSLQQSEDDLYSLIHDGNGVCQQLSQALSLVSQIDFSQTKKGMILYYVATDIKLNGQDLAHAFNVLNIGNSNALVIDISSMIHAKDGDYKQEKSAFFLKDGTAYCNNMESEGVEIKTHKENGNIITYPFLIDTNEHYKLLNNDKQTFEKYQNNGVVFNFKHEDIESSI